MSKKNKDREVTRLRAEVEFLKAQLKTVVPETFQQAPAIKTGTATPISGGGNQSGRELVYQVEPAILKKDLIKTFSLTGLALVLLFGVYFSEPLWPPVGRGLSTYGNNIMTTLQKQFSRVK